MDLRCETHRAEWTIPYPSKCKPENIPTFLHTLTAVDSEMEACPWHLANRLVNCLENPEAIFEYLHLTEFFRARAVMLTLKGKVLNQAGLFAALSKYQVQVGGIYRYHLIRTARTFLEKHNLAQLPECDIHTVDPFHGPQQVEKNRELIHCVIKTAEFDFLTTLNFISVATELHEELGNRSLEYWVKGAEKPDVVFVAVQVQETDYGYDVMPPPDEVKRLTRERRLVLKFTVRKQGELPLGGLKTDDRERMTVGGGQLADPVGSGQLAVSSDPKRPHAKVIGDFNVIVLPKGRKMVLNRKYKRRAFLRAVHTWCTKHQTDTFYWQDILEDYNVMFKISGQRTQQIVTDRIDHDLFRGQKSDFHELFQILNRSAGHLRLKLTFLVSQMGCWSVLLAFCNNLCEYADDLPW